jgi:hypothetical protein
MLLAEAEEESWKGDANVGVDTVEELPTRKCLIEEQHIPPVGSSAAIGLRISTLTADGKQHAKALSQPRRAPFNHFVHDRAGPTVQSSSNTAPIVARSRDWLCPRRVRSG